MPNMMADSMSRPCASVPSRNLKSPPGIQDGGIDALSRSSEATSKGLVGASQGENTAPTTRMVSASNATIVVTDWRKLCQRWLSDIERKSIQVALMWRHQIRRFRHEGADRSRDKAHRR
jgi:hypothetical protein